MRRALAAVAAAAVAALLVATGAAITGTDTITTVAGNGTATSTGDNGPAGLAGLNAPYGLSFDNQGRLLIAEFAGQRVRRVAANGIITTIAGNGTAGFSGDGGPATAAQLNLPYDVAGDGAGNVYINDQNNNRIRKVDPGGTITTFANVTLPQGIDVDPAGNVYVVEQPASRILRFPPSGGTPTVVAGNGTPGFSGDGGPATAAQLQFPAEVAVGIDGRTLYIADQSNHRVRRVTPDGIITTIAGTGTAGFTGDNGPATLARLNMPVGVEQDLAGNVYISDAQNRRVRKVTPAGIITSVAGNGAATPLGDGGEARAAAIGPRSLLADPAGNLLIGDVQNNRVRAVLNLAPSASLAAFPPSGPVPLTVSFDGSGSSDPNGTIIAHSWDFGDGASAVGPKVSHTYATPGTFVVRLTVRDDSGATATATKAVTPGGPAVSPLVLSDASFVARWRASRLRPGRLVLAGGVARPAVLRVQLRRGRKVVLTRNFRQGTPGLFVRRLGLPAKFLPGRYVVRVFEPGRGPGRLPRQERRATLKPPREGVVARAFVSTKIGGRLMNRIRERRSIMFAHFSFAARPKKGQRLTVSWYAPGRRRPVAVDRKAIRPQVIAFIKSGQPLARGRWRAELRYGGKPVATARVRVG